jgi:hypothetical protein
MQTFAVEVRIVKTQLIMTKKIIISSILFIFFGTKSPAQVEKNSELYKTILSKDSLLFDIGFNHCNITQFENLLSDKFEFFHDKDSISYKKEFLYNLKNGLCKSPTTYQSRRELVSESTEIYPLYKRCCTEQFKQEIINSMRQLQVIKKPLQVLQNLLTFGF